jgi:hypothetical protein
MGAQRASFSAALSARCLEGPKSALGNVFPGERVEAGRESSCGPEATQDANPYLVEVVSAPKSNTFSQEVPQVAIHFIHMCPSDGSL